MNARKGHHAVLFVLLGLAGCARQGAEFPLVPGKSWTYSVRSGLVTQVETVRVGQQVPVAGVTGYEVGGPLGHSRLAWKGNTLVADHLVNASFSPAVPLLVGGLAEGKREWRGKMHVLGVESPAIATLEQHPESRALGGKTVATTRSTLTVRAQGRRVELVTWFVPGRGPIAQEQRTDELMDVDLETVGMQ